MELVINTQPVDGEYWITIDASASGCTLDRRGPYSTVEAAEEAAKTLCQCWNVRPAELPPPRHAAETEASWDLLAICTMARAVRARLD
jgi:hypothetical protein